MLSREDEEEGGDVEPSGDILENKELEKWDCVEVSLFLAKIGLSHLQQVCSIVWSEPAFMAYVYDVFQVFLDQEVDGSILMDVSDDDLELIPMDSPTERKKLLDCVQIQKER
jgi:hypothetical protein